MQCKFCDKPATVHLSQIVDNKVIKIDLCEECAKEKGVDDPVGNSLTELLAGLGAVHSESSEGESTEMRCPRCGYSPKDFKKSGRLGCPACYETFRNILEPLLKSMHKGVKHVGKCPASLRRTQDITARLRQLEEELQEAIRRENYEQAAVLRDRIKQIKDENSDILANLA